MEWLQPFWNALYAGADMLIEMAVPVAVAYATWMANRYGLLGFLFRPIIDDAARYAEEQAKAYAKQHIDKGQTMASREKLELAIAYVRGFVPNWLLSDATVEKWIVAALPRLGLGAAGAVQFIIERGKTAIDQIPNPPASA